MQCSIDEETWIYVKEVEKIQSYLNCELFTSDSISFVKVNKEPSTSISSFVDKADMFLLIIVSNFILVYLILKLSVRNKA